MEENEYKQLISEIKDARLDSDFTEVLVALLAETGADDEYFQLAANPNARLKDFPLDSLDSVELIMRYEKHMNCILPDDEIFEIENVTLGELTPILRRHKYKNNREV